MKRTLCLLLAAGLLAGCVQSTSQPGNTTPAQATDSPPDSSFVLEEEMDEDIPDTAIPATNAVYRGQVQAVYEDSIEVVQVLPGHDYGYQRIQFHVDDTTLLDTNSLILQEGAYVEIGYDGTLTRSEPPQGHAEYVSIISSFSDNILLNGYIVTASIVENGYRLLVHPFTDAELREIKRTGELSPPENSEESIDTVVLLVSASALEGIGEADLVEGLYISAVTRGIAALSMPPQYPVHALCTFSVE